MSKDNNKNNGPPEMESLNADDLDIEQLERRIELAGLSMDPMAWVCGADGNCGVNCDANCVGDCSTLCGALVCDTYCGTDSCGALHQP
jgi:hypothetical protein